MDDFYSTTPYGDVASSAAHADSDADNNRDLLDTANDLGDFSVADFVDYIQTVANFRAVNGGTMSRLNYANRILEENRINLESAHGQDNEYRHCLGVIQTGKAKCTDSGKCGDDYASQPNEPDCTSTSAIINIKAIIVIQPVMKFYVSTYLQSLHYLSSRLVWSRTSLCGTIWTKFHSTLKKMSEFKIRRNAASSLTYQKIYKLQKSENGKS